MPGSEVQCGQPAQHSERGTSGKRKEPGTKPLKREAGSHGHSFTISGFSYAARHPWIDKSSLPLLFRYRKKWAGFRSRRRVGNVYNWLCCEAVGNAVCWLWESRFCFSIGCEQYFPWRSGQLCTFSTRFFSAKHCLLPFKRSVATTILWCSDRRAPALCRGFGELPNKRGK